MFQTDNDYGSGLKINTSGQLQSYSDYLKEEDPFSLDNFSFSLTPTFSPYSSWGTGLKRRNPLYLGIGLDSFTSFETEETPTEETEKITKISERVKVGTFEDYNCPRETRPLSDLASALNWTECYKDRVSFTASDENSDSELLKQDKEICDCLRSSVLLPISSVMNSDILANQRYRGVASEVERTLNQNKELVNKDHDATLNGLMFHSAFATGSINFTKAYSSSLFQGDENENAFKFRTEGDKIIGHELNFREPKREGELVVDSKEPYRTGQCISARQYMINRQFPSVEDKDSKYILDDLKKGFDQKSWDYQTLEKDYRALMALPLSQRRIEGNREKIKGLKAKLKFLNRSPLIKYLMGASKEDFEKMDLELAPEIKAKFDQSQPESFAASKQELFGIMQMLGDEGCNSSKAYESDCQDRYKNALGEFFKKPKHVGMVSLSSHNDILKKTHERIRNAEFLSGGASTPQSTGVSQRSIVQEFVNKYKLPSPDTCKPDITSSSAIECVDVYAGYCKVLEKRMPEIDNLSSEEDLEIADNLDELLANDFNPDYQTNPEFQAYNDEICNKKPSGFLGFGKKLSVNEFQVEFCNRGEHSGQQYCRSPLNGEGWNKIWAHYLEEVNPKDARVRLADPGRHGSSMSYSDIASITGNTSSDIFSFLNESESSTNAFSSRDGINEKMSQQPGGEGEESIYSAVSSKPASVNQEDLNSVPYFNYASPISNVDPISKQNESTEEVPKVEEMSQIKREEMLADWEKEYEEWKESKGNNLSPADSAANEKMKAEIATLKALLAQQQQMSKQQLDLLNDAIAARKRDNEVEQNKPSENGTKAASKNASSIFAANSRPVEEEVNRGPASVNETPFNTAGSKSGAKGASLGGTGSGSGAASTSSSSNSSDSVAREEAKLVNLRKFSDGSITIEATQKNNSQGGNAISVPVSDEQYRILQTNPSGLNLSQIEKRIPPEHIAKLEKNGEIILLLQNGA
ncbi:MAG: hypothetical protein ACLGHN_16005, partial [Bacteriovoracia bacterium]